MTPEEAKKLVAGDVVVLHATVTGVVLDEPQIRAHIDGTTWWFDCKSIHSVLPRPLAVGDRVTWSEGRTSSSPGEIVAQDNGWFWVRWSPTSHDTLSAIELERVP